MATTPKNRNVAALLAILFGSLGAQYFYLEKFGKGLVCVFFCWTLIPGIIGVINGIRYLMMSDYDFNARYGCVVEEPHRTMSQEESMRHMNDFIRQDLSGNTAMNPNTTIHNAQQQAQNAFQQAQAQAAAMAAAAQSQAAQYQQMYGQQQPQQPLYGQQQASSQQPQQPASTPKFCTSCGAPLTPGQKFCTSCGSKI